jgi:PEP-CTERM motif
MKRRGGVQIALGAAAVLLSVGVARAAESPVASACQAVAADASWSDCAASLEARALSAEATSLPLAAADRLRAGGVAAPLVPGIPEPPSFVLMLAGVAAIGFMATRRRRD